MKIKRHKMFVRKFTAIFFLSSIFIFSQNLEKPEAKNYGRIFAPSKIEYPGDPSTDIKYYGLNLKITYNPDYLTGSVILKAAPSETSFKYILSGFTKHNDSRFNFIR